MKYREDVMFLCSIVAAIKRNTTKSYLFYRRVSRPWLNLFSSFFAISEPYFLESKGLSILYSYVVNEGRTHRVFAASYNIFLY
jgi:hypothetical protein